VSAAAKLAHDGVVTNINHDGNATNNNQEKQQHKRQIRESKTRKKRIKTPSCVNYSLQNLIKS
jgi:hypothetical protein